MSGPRRFREAGGLGLLVILSISITGCGDGGTGSQEEETGATLQGQIVLMGVAGPGQDLVAPASLQDPITYLAAAPTSNVSVTVGEKSTKTDGSGSFVVNDIPLGDPTVVFSGSGIVGSYSLNGVAEGSLFVLNGIQVTGQLVKTEHTGTWVGTAGSSEPGSQGQIAFTLTIAANGNLLTGTGSVEAPDNSQWTMAGTETGKKVEGVMALVSSNSSCATGATFTGDFKADTLEGTFVEVNPPAGCGAPESGTFRVVKQ